MNMHFDTLATTRDLEAAGIERPQAEAIASAIGRTDEQLATKADITSMETNITTLKGDVAVLKTDVSALKSDVFALKAGLIILEQRMTIRLGAMMFASAGIVIAAIKLL